ncbi:MULTISPECIES: AraC family transcriptional regulator [Paraburkholderia]|uniref:AraC-like DNA-binding protein n=1 Tax=Paraburkholderia tropica TaxID=92647 RepID=A0ABX5MDI3_9BURK|nr:AraC family transcriptional regulator [Paraburkholderia tropica]MBB3002821.1 AraC-like DNA-binding protein [Paraburkholderia tropica]MBB6320418.1 AraC-like DNA-binding protein [Paraburkholderia tropica]MDE1138281.1 AraC family transcriptional regulator [Paraburkholderia tropica]OBR47581.1 AraC family transcriptional regulator [Paraburkholderia tropica]PXX03192.1 AraC-like DNA-binding protein [Paraburkholderia tropica]
MSRARRSSETDWIQRAVAVEGVERMEAFFTGNAYASHRHDTYAIGRSLAGVHDFQYRRGKRRSLPGHTIVLHPDELHDGQAGAEGGFRYRMIYVEPTLFQDALAGRALPFIEHGVSTDPRLLAATDMLLQPMNVTLDPMEQAEALADLAMALATVSGARPAPASRDFASARRAREFLHENALRVVTLDELEAITGRDRWSLTRDFHTFYGTSPYRFLTLRRLDAARRMMEAGTPLASVAAATGFTDQSHLTRHFGKAFGIAPARWLQMLRDPTADHR